ncbi:MAG: hypothetical protein ACRCSO_01295 [Sphingomonas sp.]
MSRLTSFAALTMLFAASSASAQQVTLAIELPCVSQGDAEAIVTSVLPDVIENVGHLCAPQLPPRALLRQTDGSFIAKYRAEADLAWPRAEASLRRVLGDTPGAGLLFGSSFGRPLTGTILAPVITRNLNPADCPRLERISELIEPLPPANAAPLFVEMLQFADAARKDRSAKPALPICQAPAR